MSILMAASEKIEGRIRDYLEHKLHSYSDMKYAYLLINKQQPEKWFCISNYPEEWLEEYRSNNYPYIDPVVQTAQHRVSPFAWHEVATIEQSQNYEKIFNRAKQHNIVSGCTFTLHDYANNVALLSLSTVGEKIGGVNRIIKNHKNRLQMLLVETHEKSLAELPDIIDISATAPALKSIVLTPRENEILFWASIGKTYQEISLILNIKIGTVKFHIGNVVKKFGVLNAKHAIRLGVEYKIIEAVKHKPQK